MQNAIYYGVAHCKSDLWYLPSVYTLSVPRVTLGPLVVILAGIRCTFSSILQICIRFHHPTQRLVLLLSLLQTEILQSSHFV